MTSHPGPARGIKRGFSAILLGTAVGQLASFVAIPVLSRFYTPEQFGVLTFALVVTAAVAPMALLGFDQAIIKPRDDRNVRPLLTAALISLLTSCLLLAAALAWTPLNASLDPSELPFLLWALPLLLLVTGISLLLSQLAVRQRRYASIGNRNSLQSLTITGSQLAFIGTARSASFNGLVSGALIGTALGSVLLAPYARPYAGRVGINEMRTTIKRFWRFPVVFAPLASTTLFAQQTPALFVLFVFGTAEAGFVGMAERIVAVPLALIGLAAGSVFSGELAHSLRTSSTDGRRLFLRTSAWLAIPAALTSLSVFFLAPPLAPVLLGDNWDQAALVMQSMAIVAFTRMIANPTRATFRVLERARVLTLVESARVALLAVAIAWALLSGWELIPSLILIFAALAITDVMTWVCAWQSVRTYRQR